MLLPWITFYFEFICSCCMAAGSIVVANVIFFLMSFHMKNFLKKHGIKLEESLIHTFFLSKWPTMEPLIFQGLCMIFGFHLVQLCLYCMLYAACLLISENIDFLKPLMEYMEYFDLTSRQWYLLKNLVCGTIAAHPRIFELALKILGYLTHLLCQMYHEMYHDAFSLLFSVSEKAKQKKHQKK